MLSTNLSFVDWELVFRVAMGTETAAAEKWLDDTKGYSEGLKQAQSTTIGNYRQTYKNRIVNDWQDIGVQKVLFPKKTIIIYKY